MLTPGRVHCVTAICLFAHTQLAPPILVNLITPATVIGGVTLIQRTVESQKASTDAQIAAQKASTDAQIAALEKSTDAQIKAINTVADGYRAILRQLTTPGAGAEKQ